MGILDLLFPKYCVNCRKIGSFLCPTCFSLLSFDDKTICLVCQKASFNHETHPVCRRRHTIDGSFSALKYNSVAKKLISSFKFKPYVKELQKLLASLFYESLIQNEYLHRILGQYHEIILVPIPLTSSKMRSRGYNQSEILAESLARNLKLPTSSRWPSGLRGASKTQNLLMRTKETRTQVGLKKKQRRENISGVFRISNKYQFQISNLKYNSYFLVDDVLTTGATLMEAAKVLKQNGAKRVWGLTLARD